jgi:hypothetical protein
VDIAKTGRVNYTTLEDVPEGEQVLAGIFSLNGHPVVVLYYSGATHNFISKSSVDQNPPKHTVYD